MAGILIELHRGDPGIQGRGGGLGVNIPVTGVGAGGHRSAGVGSAGDAARTMSRNTLAATLISSIVDFSEGFAERGFEPMRETFDGIHRFHDTGHVCCCWAVKRIEGDGSRSHRCRGVASGGRG